MRTLLLGFVFLAGSAAQGLAAKHEWKGYRWIRFYNDHDAPMLIEFRIAILCN